MHFLKLSPGAVWRTVAVCLETLVWVLIYGGLLALVLGLSVQRLDEDGGATLVQDGALATALGLALIFVRALIKTDF